MGLMFSGIDLKSTYNFVVTRVDGRGSPPVSRDVLDMPRVDGDIEINSKLKSRNITITGYVYGTDAATKKDDLIKLITLAYSQEKELKFPDTNRSIYVKLVGDPIVIGPIGPVLNAQAYEITFNFVAQDPYFYADEHNEAGWGYIKVNADAPTYLMSPRRQFLKREPKIEIYPITIVNLFGKYGNFETDSNGDGLADGWSAAYVDTLTLSTGLIGSKAQTLSYDTTSGKAEFWIRRSVSVPLGQHKVFYAVYYKHTDINADTGLFRLDIGFYNNSTWLAAHQVTFARSNVWTRAYTVAVHTADYNNLEVLVKQLVDDTTTDDEVLIDGVMLVDLTAMGQLPPSLQEFFQNQVTNWENLATTSNITAIDGRTQTGEDWLAELLPYVDSVATVGYSFNDGQLDIVIENRGENLWHKTNYDGIFYVISLFESLSPTSFVLALGPKTTDIWYGIYFKHPVVSGKTYKFSMDVEFLDYVQGFLRVRIMDGITQQLITQASANSSRNVQLTFTATSDLLQIELRKLIVGNLL